MNSSISSTTIGSQEELLNQTCGRFSDEESEFSRSSTSDYVVGDDLNISKDLDATLDADWTLAVPDESSPRMRRSRGSEHRAAVTLERFGMVMSSQDSTSNIIIPTMTFTAKAPPPMMKSRGPATPQRIEEKQPVEHEDTSLDPPQRVDTYLALATLPRHRCKGKIEIGEKEIKETFIKAKYSKFSSQKHVAT